MLHVSGAERFLALRRALIADDQLSAADRRRSLSELADNWLGRFFDDAPDGAAEGMALVAVGGFGRRELLPGSDVDVVLIHGDDGDPEEVASRVFYPVWDAGLPLDHSVRTLKQARELAASDLKVALGLIDARHVAGDAEIAETLRSEARADWRRDARTRLPELEEMCRARAESVGELAHLLEPDLVEAFGGLRDTLALRAVAASWVADQPHSAEAAQAREWLLVVRDALHRTTGRSKDRLLFHDQDDVAARLGLLSADALLRTVAEAGRAIGYASNLTWRAVLRTLSSGRGPRTRAATRRARPAAKPAWQRRPLAAGVVEHEGEAVLALGTRPELEPVLPLRAAAAAAQAGLVLAPQTLDQLATICPPLPEPWPEAARDALVSLLGAGRSALPVWESLEMAGLVTRWFPEWERVQFKATRTPVHRHTVDRHLIESAMVASGLTRRVSRPDLLLLAALFHDLGKGLSGDHSETGSVIAGEIGRRMGLPPVDAATLAQLVRHHLLLPEMATRRDPDDPATIAAVVRAVGNADILDLLAALTEADATAAGPIAWSPQRAALITDLVARVRDVLGGAPLPKPERLAQWQRELAEKGELAIRRGAPSSEGIVDVTVVAPGEPGLLAHVAGVLALRRLDVRRAAIEGVGEQAVLTLTVSAHFGDPPDEATLRDDIARALSGRLDIAERMAERASQRRGRTIRHAEPRVSVLPDASECATVVEVRAHDEPTLLYRLTNAIAESGGSIRAAAIETLGAEAIDVFYLVDGDSALPEEQTARAVAALRSAIT